MFKFLFTVAWFIYDLYLTIKYWLFKPVITEIPYDLCEIVFVTGDEIGSISTDLNLRKAKININLVSLAKKYYIHISENTIVYIFFEYAGITYILPYSISTEKDNTIQLPIYTSNDIDSCMPTEFDSIMIDDCEISDYQKTLINSFAGPKGNFYCDTAYTFGTNSLVDPDDDYHHMISNGQSLEIVTMLDQRYKFKNNEELIIN